MKVFLIDDDEDDIELLKKAFIKNQKTYHFKSFVNGVQLFEHIRDNSDEVPDCFIVDFKMPLMSGIETVKKIKEITELKAIPIIMLSTSKLNGDIEKAYKAGVNSYITKPSAIKDWVRTTNAINNWLTTWANSKNIRIQEN